MVVLSSMSIFPALESANQEELSGAHMSSARKTVQISLTAIMLKVSNIQS